MFVDRSNKFDLSEHKFLKKHRTVSGELEEWVHVDDFAYYKEQK